ncbi:MAG: Nramp family divalent metal transporter [Anaerolineales bacterium]|jgi:manganese transport protein
MGDMADRDLQLQENARKILEGKTRRSWLARLLPFLGPAFIASVAYIDPGNFATNIQSGAQFNYTLLWVIVASNLMAMLIQATSAKLGIATGKNLAEVCRDQYPRPLVLFMWVAMEIVAISTDLAEFIGAALGFNLLFGVPLWLAGLITGAVSFLILELQKFGIRPLEAIIGGLVSVVAVSYLIETVLDRPVWNDVLYHAFVPQFQGSESVLLAVGILGATVMPHAIFLHSHLTQNRIKAADRRAKRLLYRFELVDVVIAMGIAGLVNAAMLIMAAATFYSHGMKDVASIEQAYQTLQPLLGAAAGWIFAVSLLASGLSSASVGTMAGQVIMQGFLQRKIPAWLRRLVTMIPSMVVLSIGLDPTRTLVISQVVLSFGLPLAVTPLWMFARRRDLMGDLANTRITSAVLAILLFLIVALNGYLLFGILSGN